MAKEQDFVIFDSAVRVLLVEVKSMMAIPFMLSCGCEIMSLFVMCVEGEVPEGQYRDRGLFL